MAATLSFDILARDRASKVFDQVGAKAAKTEQNLSKVGTSSTAAFGKMTAAVGGLALGWQAWDKVMVGGFNRLANLDDARKRLDQMGLSTSEAAGLMDGLNDVVTGTAFSLDAGANAMTGFISAGVDLDEVNDRLRMTADTAAFAQQPLDDIALIFQKIQTQGKLTAEEVNMLAERGVPALALLSDAAGVTAEAMRDMISRGEVDAERFFDLWETGSKGFGENNIKIEGAAKSMGDTLRGSLANAETALSRMGAGLLEEFIPAIQETADQVKGAADGVLQFLDATQQVRDVIGDVFAKINPDEQEGGWGEFLKGAKDAAVDAALAWTPLGPIIGLVSDNADDAAESANFFGTEADRVRGVVEGLVPVASAAADELGRNASQAQMAADTLGAYLDTVARATDPVLALSGALDDVDAAQDEYNASVKEYGENSPQAQGAALKLAGAVAKAESAAIDGRLSFDQFDRKLEQWVAQGAITAAQADTIRSRVKTLRGEAENFAGTYKAKLDLKTQGLNTWINAKAWLDSIKSKTVTITAHAQLPPGVTTRQIMEGRQHGGPVRAGEPYIVGERGPELFVPNRSGLVVSNRNSKATGGSRVGAGAAVVNNYFTLKNHGVLGSQQDVERWLARSINRLQRIGHLNIARQLP